MDLLTGFLRWDDSLDDGADLYVLDAVDTLAEDDEISAEEEGFMLGYLRS